MCKRKVQVTVKGLSSVCLGSHPGYRTYALLWLPPGMWTWFTFTPCLQIPTTDSLQMHTERLLKSSLYLSSFTWLVLHSTSPDLQQKAPQTMFTALEWNITCSCTFSPSPSSLEHGCEALWICAFQIATLKTPKPFSFCSFWVWIYWQSRVQLRLSLSSLI